MSALLVLWVGFGVTVASIEGLLKSRKLQGAVGRIVITHAIGLAALIAVLVPSHRLGIVPIFIFWSGALLCWFGVRSHIESSILLRMVHMLRRNPVRGRDLTSQYESFYGRTQRIEELLRAGLLRADLERATMTPTRKGTLIAELVLRLR
jgi:hypothetical protein